jgi:hypothetical protein
MGTHAILLLGMLETDTLASESKPPNFFAMKHPRIYPFEGLERRKNI